MIGAVYIAEFIQVTFEQRRNLLDILMVFFYNVIYQLTCRPGFVIRAICIVSRKVFFEIAHDLFGYNMFCLAGLVDRAVAFATEIDPIFFKYSGCAIISSDYFTN